MHFRHITLWIWERWETATALGHQNRTNIPATCLWLIPESLSVFDTIVKTRAAWKPPPPPALSWPESRQSFQISLKHKRWADGESEHYSDWQPPSSVSKYKYSLCNLLPSSAWEPGPLSGSHVSYESRVSEHSTLYGISGDNPIDNSGDWRTLGPDQNTSRGRRPGNNELCCFNFLPGSWRGSGPCPWQRGAGVLSVVMPDLHQCLRCQGEKYESQSSLFYRSVNLLSSLPASSWHSTC